LACQLAEPPKPKQSNNVRDAPACLLSNWQWSRLDVIFSL
jgi:hypothetical protein